MRGAALGIVAGLAPGSEVVPDGPPSKLVWASADIGQTNVSAAPISMNATGRAGSPNVNLEQRMGHPCQVQRTRVKGIVWAAS